MFYIPTPLVSPRLTQVLEAEPWDATRHDRKVRAAWQECGERVPGSLKKNARSSPGLLVQQQVFRMAWQLNTLTARPAWKSNPVVKHKVEAVATRLAAEPRLKVKFRLSQQPVAYSIPDDGKTEKTGKDGPGRPEGGGGTVARRRGAATA